MMITHSIKPASVLCTVAFLGSMEMVQAQDTASPTVSPATPAAPAAPGQAANFTDAELEQYVRAALAVQQIQQDTATPDADKQAKMASAVQANGLTPEKFNQMATASQSDPALQQRLQAIAAKLQGSAPQ